MLFPGPRGLGTPVVHFLGCGTSKQCESAHGILTVCGRQSEDHRSHSLRIEDGLRISKSRPGLCKPQINDSAVSGIARAGHVVATDQPVNGQRHRGRADTHVSGEAEQAGRLDVIEMIEDPSLIGADSLASLGIAHVTRVAGVKDSRIILKHSIDDVIYAHRPAVYGN